MRRRNRAGAASIAVALVALAASAPASAAQIPKGDYGCSSFSLGFAGTVNIKGKNRYSVNDNKTGEYKFSRNTQVITFKTGDYRSFYGIYFKDKQGFDIYDKKTHGYGWSCSRD